MGLSRRTFLGGGLVLMGCGRTALDAPDEPQEAPPEDPLAQRPEEDMTNEAQGLTQPVILWGSTIAQPNVDSAVPNEQLANPFQIPIEILSVRFRVYPIVTATRQSARLTGSGVKVKLDIGDVAVASDIPISLFGDVRGTYENGQVIQDLASVSALAYPCTYDWKLKYPLYIPPGKAMSAVFTPIGLNQLPVRIDVLYICRTWDVAKPLPRKVKAPWAASFESKSFRNESDLDAEVSVSNALDVLNPFAVPLELAFIGGRCAALKLTATYIDTYTDFVYEDPVLYRHMRSAVRMRSSRGFDLIRTPVPFEGVFPAGWRGWDVPDGWQMSPQEYYKVQVDMTATATVAAADISQAQFSVGIVGYRDVEVSSMGGKS
jgi:hypothetical protein